MQINLKFSLMFYSFFCRLFFFFPFLKYLVSVMATKSSLCRQTVWASKPQTASWSELVTTNNYQIHNSDLEKAIKQSSVLLRSKVKKVRNKQLFPLYPFLSHSTVCDTALHTKGTASSLQISYVFLKCIYRDPWCEGDFVLMKSKCDEWYHIWFRTPATLWNKALIVHVAEKLPDS